MEDFDVLKREATKLERHLEDRVAKYQQVSSFRDVVVSTFGFVFHLDYATSMQYKYIYT